MLTINELSLQFPEHLWLALPNDQIELAWLASQQYSNDAAKWNAYLNRLCLNTLLPWLQEESGAQAKLLPNQHTIPKIWEFVNGSAISLDKTRMIFIPSEAIDIEEFSVPQEWIDIPNWIGDYYFPIQINLDEGWLRVWGYTTHQQLKTRGNYDNFERTYTIKPDDIFDTIQAMWLAIELSSNEKEAVKPLPNLLPTVAEELLTQLSQPSSYSPRLDLEFETWAILLSHEGWLQQLYQKRIQNQEVSVVSSSLVTNSQTVKKAIHLSQWFENIVDSGWKNIEEVLGTQPIRFAFRTQSADLPTLMAQIYAGTTEEQRRKAAEQLGRIDRYHPNVSSKLQEVIKALVYLIQTTEHEETRWAAAESLWNLDPHHPTTGIRKIKDLGMLLWNYPVALGVWILQKSHKKYAIFIRVYPLNAQAYLPPNLQLIILSESGQTFLEVKARNEDNCIQLKFSGNQGERFSAKVMLSEAAIVEDFVI